MNTPFSRRSLLAGAGLAGLGLWAAPLFATAASPRTLTLRTDQGRPVKVSHWRPARKARGVIAFSHGAFSAPWKYDPLILPWVAAGYSVYAPLHVDSSDHPDAKQYTGLMSWKARIEDMRALARHIGKRDYIAAGHSYGALTALTLGGAAATLPDGMAAPLRDSHVQAVVAFSPPGPMDGLIGAQGYESLAVPALIQTGTKDVPPGGTDWRVHLAAYEAALPGGDRYALVLDGVDHYFGGLICRPELPGPAQQVQMDAAQMLTGQFLRAFASSDSTARAALDANIGSQGIVQLLRK